MCKFAWSNNTDNTMEEVKQVRRYECAISSNCILLRGSSHINIVQTAQILYLTALQGYVEIACLSAQHITGDSLTSFETRLPGYFYRINHQVIINTHYIRDIQKRGSKCTAEITTGQRFDVSRRRQTPFLRHLREQFCR